MINGIEEILSLSENPKNPSCTVYLKEQEETSQEKAQEIMYFIEQYTYYGNKKQPKVHSRSFDQILIYYIALGTDKFPFGFYFFFWSNTKYNNHRLNYLLISILFPTQIYIIYIQRQNFHFTILILFYLSII